MKTLSDTSQPPAFLVPIYQAAGRRYHIPWQVLAAINAIETNYGRNLATSSAGAIGWMQFMPSTWQEYGVDVDGHGTPNPNDPRDAIFSAAHYLAANGGGRDLRKAIFAYNHANWYVGEVLALAASISRHAVRPTSDARVRLTSMLATAHLLDGEPYVWGGGHAGWQLVAGYDCSGFVSAVLHAAGYLTVPASTETLPAAPGIVPGPGRYVTILDRAGVSAAEGHVIIDINGQWWESGGSTVGEGTPSVHRMSAVSPAYLATFNRVLHPRGL